MVVSIQYLLLVPFFIVTAKQLLSSHQPWSQKNNLGLLFVIKTNGLVLGPILGISTSCFWQNVHPLQEPNWFLKPHFCISAAFLIVRSELSNSDICLKCIWMWISNILFKTPYLHNLICEDQALIPPQFSVVNGTLQVIQTCRTSCTVRY